MDRTEISETYGILQAMKCRNYLKIIFSKALRTLKSSSLLSVIRVKVTSMLLKRLRKVEVALNRHIKKGFTADLPIADGRGLIREALIVHGLKFAAAIVLFSLCKCQKAYIFWHLQSYFYVSRLVAATSSIHLSEISTLVQPSAVLARSRENAPCASLMPI